MVTTKSADATLVSHTGVPLTRSTTFRFTLDPNREQEQRLRAHAGAARLAYNHHLARMKADPTSAPPNAATVSTPRT